MGLSIERMELESATDIQDKLDAMGTQLDHEWITSPLPLSGMWDVEIDEDSWYDLKSVDADLILLLSLRVKGEVEVWHSDGWFVKYVLSRDEVGPLLRVYHGAVTFTDEPDLLRGERV